VLSEKKTSSIKSYLLTVPYERLDFPLCTARIVRLCSRGCAEIGKS